MTHWAKYPAKAVFFDWPRAFAWADKQARERNVRYRVEKHAPLWVAEPE